MDLTHGSQSDNPDSPHHSSLPPALSAQNCLAEAEEENTRSRPFVNGTPKKHRPEPPPPPPLAWPRPQARNEHRMNHLVYMECMKNHAVSLGGHALDGCGEFILSPGSNPSTPSSLTCAACGCHRNFHRRLLYNVEGVEASWEEEGDVNGHSPSPTLRKASSLNQCSSPAPMLTTLSGGYYVTAVKLSPMVGPGTSSTGTPITALARSLPGKRFRTKFTSEQKARMQELCEHLGWRMQRRDDELVEQRLQEIGVTRGVFKVWMHNNKHAFVGGPSSRRAAVGSGAGDGGTADQATSHYGGGGGSNVLSVNGDRGNGGSSSHTVLNSSPCSS